MQALAQDDAGQQGRQKGRYAHQHAHVGRRAVAQGDVLQQKVEGHAAQARQGKGHFPAPVTHMQQAGAGQQQGTGPQQKAQEKDLDGRKGLQQHLGGGEGGAPDEDGQDGGRVGGKSGIHGAASLGRRAPGALGTGPLPARAGNEKARCPGTARLKANGRGRDQALACCSMPSSMSFSSSWPKSMPSWAASCGTRLVGVMPGRVLTSSRCRLSSGPRMKSARL